ncbi:uncharacterized protein [Dermacentor andersoni]|uniref:uncharacterized protein isoform X3 n=1 Tax=Dermacentor andersoni TaxID=34620 RepID=UPI002155A4BA|nr:uncharacterized protein LOC126544439 isoform X3 [Dermacentor andersoni]
MGRPRIVRTPEEQRARDERRREQQRQYARRRRAMARQDAAVPAQSKRRTFRTPEERREYRERRREQQRLYAQRRRARARQDPVFRAQEAERKRQAWQHNAEHREAANAAKRRRYRENKLERIGLSSQNKRKQPGRCSRRGNVPVESAKAVQTEATGSFPGRVDVAVGTSRVVDRDVCKSAQTSLAAEKVHVWTETVDLDAQDSGPCVGKISELSSPQKFEDGL